MNNNQNKDTPSPKPNKKFIDYGRDSKGIQRTRNPKNTSPDYVLRLRLIDTVAQALDEIQTFIQPADSMLSHYFKRNPHLGQRDRAWISGLVWHVLRHKRLLSQLAQSGTGSFSRRLAQLALVRTHGIEACNIHSTEEEYSWLQHITQISIHSLAPAIQASMPDWLYAYLEAAYDKATLDTVLPALLEPAPLTLRVNTFKSDRDTVMAQLAYKKIPATIHPITPWAIALNTHPHLAKLDAYNNGWVEIQDAGSQVLALLSDAKRGQMVADFCAGAGGKTLALGAMMRNTGRLYAFDVNAFRLKGLQPRLARSGLSNIAPIVLDSESDSKLKRLIQKFDSVLVDAPCSGLGTLRRNPDLKWRQHPKDIVAFTETQTRILNSASRLVKAGGRLVYSTCSILPAENQTVVEHFLTQHPEFTLIPAMQECERLGIHLNIMDTPQAFKALDINGMLQLLPTSSINHNHNNNDNDGDKHLSLDGFFVAIMVRRKVEDDKKHENNDINQDTHIESE